MWQPFENWIGPVLAIITNKVNWTWASNSRCKYINIRIDMRDGAAVIRDEDGNEISVKDLSRQLKGGEYRDTDMPTLEELGIDCSNLKT